jgi:hypothetical protein
MRSSGQLDEHLVHLCGQVIRCLGQNFKELDLGTYVRVPRDGGFSDLADEFMNYKRFHFAWKDRPQMIQEVLDDRTMECGNLERSALANMPGAGGHGSWQP